MKRSTVRVYDTILKKVVEVEVSDEIYTNFQRTKWAIENNDWQSDGRLQSSLYIGYQG